jgi:hypothetical protein
MEKLTFTVLMIFLAIAGYSQSGYRDTVYLKNGSVIKGIIIEQVPNKQIKIETSDGSVLVYGMDEIEKISNEKIAEIPPHRNNARTDFFMSTVKGNVLLSGSTKLSFSSLTNEVDEELDSDVDVKEFSFNSSLGYFIEDNLALAFSFSYEVSRSEYEGSKNKERLFLIGPSLTFFCCSSSNIKPFVQGECMVGNLMCETDYGDESHVEGWSFGTGVACFLNRNISLDLGLGYVTINYDDFELKSKGLNYNGGITAYF